MGSSRSSKFVIFLLLLMIALVGSSCSYYNRVMARMNLVDGAQAYNERKFDEAIEKFHRAVEYDPEGNTLESKTAQLFLARTLHSLYAGNRRDKQKAEMAIEEYRKALPGFLRETAENKAALDAAPGDEKLLSTYEKNKNIVGSIVSAIGSLYENLQQDDKWQNWQKQSAENTQLPGTVRANAYVAMAAKKYDCANEISDDDAVKKTVNKGGEQVFEFTKPAEEADFAKLKKCVQEGTAYIDEAIKLHGESDSAWSYKASMLVQSMRIAEMEGNSAEKEKFKKDSEEAKAKFEELAKIRREKEEEAARKAAEKVGGEAKGGDKKDASDAKKEESGSKENK